MIWDLGALCPISSGLTPPTVGTLISTLEPSVSLCHVTRPYFEMGNTIMPNIFTEGETAHNSGARAQITTTIATFGGIEYHVDQIAVHIINLQPHCRVVGLFHGLKRDLYPCTVINLSKGQIIQVELDAITTEFALRDDVWTQAFLEGERPQNHGLDVPRVLIS